jgi:pseudouridine-5'-phosphate glycosidase
VVALESSVFAQGLPAPHNTEAAMRMVAAIQDEGAVAAITAVVSGAPAAGLTSRELEWFLNAGDIRKATARDLPAAIAAGTNAATTVAGSLLVCRAAGMDVFATGGVGGVHREPPFDESADLFELSRTPAVVVCAGAKSVLDLAATVERLETLGVTVVGFGTDEFPGFFHAHTGLGVSATAESAGQVERIFRAQRALGMPGALLVVQPPPPGFALTAEEVEEATTAALAEARRRGVRGAATTPFLLSEIHRATGGRSLVANLALLEANARLASQIAAALATEEAS